MANSSNFALGKIQFAILVALFAIFVAFLFFSRKSLYALELIETTLDYFHDFNDYNRNENRFLSGNYAPVAEENSNLPLQLISGAIPVGMEGLFLRIGPNPIPDHIAFSKKRYHWFDGHGMLHSVRVNDGKAWYSNHWIETPSYLKEREVGRPFFPLVGELYGFLGLLKILLVYSAKADLLGYHRLNIGPANTAILFHNNKLYATHEATIPFEIKWHKNNTFLSVGYETFGDQLDFPVTAHPKVAESDQSLYFFGYEVLPQEGSHMKFGSIDGKSQLQSYFTVDSPSPTFSHDFFVSENYVILIESSVLFAADKILSGNLFHFNQSHSLRLGVLPKNSSSGTTIRWFSAGRPLVIVHGLNAWEETDPSDPDSTDIVIWTPLSAAFDPSLKENVNRYNMTEIRLNLKTGLMTFNTIDMNFNVEFPRMHPNYIGRKARYGFAGIMKNDTVLAGLVKFDFEQKKVAAYIRFREGCLSSEVVPVVKSGPEGEASDGLYLTTFMYNVVANQSEWVVFDGSSMARKPMVRMLVPKRVPFGFHGEWIDENSLMNHIASG